MALLSPGPGVNEKLRCWRKGSPWPGLDMLLMMIALGLMHLRPTYYQVRESNKETEQELEVSDDGYVHSLIDTYGVRE